MEGPATPRRVLQTGSNILFVDQIAGTPLATGQESGLQLQARDTVVSARMCGVALTKVWLTRNCFEFAKTFMSYLEVGNFDDRRKSNTRSHR